MIKGDCTKKLGQNSEKRKWFFSTGGIAAILALVMLTNFIVPLIIPSLVLAKEKVMFMPEIEVPINLGIEENDQKSVDAGHSPWKLDPAFVAQVFVSLQISPKGITGDYPIKYEDLNVIYNTGVEAIVEVTGDKTPTRKVYLKRLVRQDPTGIWTVVGYDPVDD